MDALRSRNGRMGEAFLLAAIFLASLAPLLVTPVIPAIDLYNHISRYYVMAHVGSDQFFRQNYQNDWGLLPNMGLDVIAVMFAGLIGPLWLAKGVIVLVFALQFFGAVALSSALRPGNRPFVAVLSAPLLYSLILTWGFANFLFGLGLLLWATAWWVRTRGRTATATAVSCLLAVLIFLAHGFAFGLYGVLIASIELGAFVAEGERTGRRALMAGLPVLAQAVAPVILFALSRTSHVAGGITNAGAAVAHLEATGGLVSRIADLVAYRVVTVVRVERGPSLLFDMATELALAALLVYGWRMRCVRVATLMAPGLVAGGVLLLVIPPTLFGVGHMSDRIPLFLAFLCVASLGVDVERRDGLAVMGAVVVIAVLRIAATALDWSGYGQDYADFRRVSDQAPARQLVAGVVIGGSRPDDDHRRCEMYAPLLTSLRGDAVGLFAKESEQPFRLIGPLRAATDRLPPGRAWGEPPGYYPRLVASARDAGFSAVLVCNPTGAPPFAAPPGMTATAVAGRFTLFRLQ